MPAAVWKCIQSFGVIWHSLRGFIYVMSEERHTYRRSALKTGFLLLGGSLGGGTFLRAH